MSTGTIANTMLPSENRLRDNKDFRRAYAKGRSYPAPIAVLYVSKRTGEEAEATPERRIGFVVSKKQGNAVVRNRIKRRLRETMRLHIDNLRDGAYDLIFVARGNAKTAEWSEIQAAVEDLLRRGGVLKQAAPTAQGSPANPVRSVQTY